MDSPVRMISGRTSKFIDNWAARRNRLPAEYNHHEHFRHIAPQYRSLRTTDRAPIVYIERQLDALRKIEAADIGCGTGRYTQLLSRHLRDKISFMYCIDYSANMLGQVNRNYENSRFRTPDMIKSSAMCLPLKDESLNCIFTFNAVHHFTLMDFLRESERILRDGGFLFIYTRLRSQNNRSIWGRFFPMFASKETRLYKEHDLQNAVSKIPGLRLQKSQTFTFDRKSSLESLSSRAESKYYSTFDLYSRSELEPALSEFDDNLRDHFDDPTKIQWVDGNILYILQKTE